MLQILHQRTNSDLMNRIGLINTVYNSCKFLFHCLDSISGKNFYEYVCEFEVRVKKHSVLVAAPRRLDKRDTALRGKLCASEKIGNHLIAQYFLFSQFLHIIEMTQRKATSLEPIPPNSGNESKKKAMKTYFCVGCGNVATQTAFFKVEGATVIERYCDNCVKTVT